MAVNNSLVKSKSDSNPLEITFKAGNADVKLSPNTVKKYLSIPYTKGSEVANQTIENLVK